MIPIVIFYNGIPFPGGNRFIVHAVPRIGETVEFCGRLHKVENVLYHLSGRTDEIEVHVR
jgi:hypothetical protein